MPGSVPPPLEHVGRMDSWGWFASLEEVRAPESPREDGRLWGTGEAPRTAALPARLDFPSHPPHPSPAAFLKGLSDKQREEHYFCKDFIKLKKIPTWKETAKGRPAGEASLATRWAASSDPQLERIVQMRPRRMAAALIEY